ncbi:MAG: ABC transporter permease, partial [Clostridia bacterium]|nr:ABC transporter permease [Clostridia bacterium]
MRQFRKIVRFELKNYMTNKVFVGITLFAVIAIAVVMFFPRLTEAIGSDTPDPDSPRSVMLVSADESIAMPIEASFAAAFPDYDVRLTETDRTAIETQIVAGKAECAFCFDSLTSYTYFVNNLSMYDTNTAIADEVLRTLYQTQEMTAHGMSAATVQGVLSAQVAHETVMLGKDQMQNFFYTYIMIFALYMVILLYGQMVASNVATEKSSRAMELLVTSADPVSMMFGKVIASCLAGLVQLVVIFGSSLFCFHANRTYWGEDGMMASFFN